jgi:hypothetical protein
MDSPVLSNWLSIIGLFITVVGFALTIWQLVRTANASEESVKAIKRTEQRMALNHLLVLLPQLQNIENDLDHAIEVNDRNWAIRTLVTCKNVASEVAALLEDQDSVDQQVVAALVSTSKIAATAKSDIISRETQSIADLTIDVRRELSGLAAQMFAVASKFKLQIGT